VIEGFGFHPGSHTIPLHTAGIVDATNFATFFTAINTKAGDVITDHNNETAGRSTRTLRATEKRRRQIVGSPIGSHRDLDECSVRRIARPVSWQDWIAVAYRQHAQK